MAVPTKEFHNSWWSYSATIAKTLVDRERNASPIPWHTFLVSLPLMLPSKSSVPRFHAPPSFVVSKVNFLPGPQALRFHPWPPLVLWTPPFSVKLGIVFLSPAPSFNPNSSGGWSSWVVSHDGLSKSVGVKKGPSLVKPAWASWTLASWALVFWPSRNPSARVTLT